MPPPHRLLVALTAALALIAAAAACASDDPPTSAPTTTSSTTTSSTTTTVPPEPGRIIAAGDSVIYDAAPGLQALLAPDQAEVVGVVAPALTRPSTRAELAQRISEAPTDLLVVMVGIWERAFTAPNGATLGQPGWEEAYAAEVLDPVRASVEAGGARLLLLRPPPMRNAAAEADLVYLGQVWERYAAAHPATVSYADSSVWFDGDRGYQDLLTDPSTGVLGRARRTDGIHLCETGARRLAAGIASMLPTVIARPLPADDGTGTEDTSWTSRFPADECPPVTG